MTPEDGATYPANAAIEVTGSWLDDSISGIEVTVDDVPHTLMPSAKLPTFPADGTNNFHRFVVIDPPPEEGQVVTLKGSVCPNGPSNGVPRHDGDGCYIDRSYVAGPNDSVAPVTSKNAGLSVEVGRYHGTDACFRPNTHWDVSAGDFTFDPTASSMDLIRLEAKPHSNVVGPSFRRLLHATSSGVVSFDDMLADADGTTPDLVDDYCFDLTPTDAAGNDGETVHFCRPCAYRDIGNGDIQKAPPLTDSDEIPGGTCFILDSSGTVGTPDADVITPKTTWDRGCSMSASRGSRSLSPWMALSALAALALRRVRYATRSGSTRR